MNFEERARKLVSEMTLAEKLAQMKYDAPAIDRLGVKAYNWWNECLHGVARSGAATVFPQAIGMAASFNKTLMYDVATAISDEARAKYNEYKTFGYTEIYQGLTYWSPNINIFRDPRWGRGQETYGEDPYLTSLMGAVFVKGLQGEEPGYLKTAACAKHFAVHSGPEKLRHTAPAVPPSTMTKAVSWRIMPKEPPSRKYPPERDNPPSNKPTRVGRSMKRQVYKIARAWGRPD